MQNKQSWKIPSAKHTDNVVIGVGNLRGGKYIRAERPLIKFPAG